MNGVFEDIVFGVQQGATEFVTAECEKHCIERAQQEAMKYLPIAAIVAVTAYYLFFGRK